SHPAEPRPIRPRPRPPSNPPHPEQADAPSPRQLTREPSGALRMASFGDMRIATLGSGLMTAALVPHWIAAGHDVLIGGRSIEHARSLARRLDVKAGSLADAAAFGEVALLAVRSEGLADVIADSGASS